MPRGADAPVLIAGGGIGGLTAALALAQAGIGSCVIEKSVGGEQTGSGIQLGPNATRILIGLGLHDALSACACRPDAIRMFDGIGGRELNHVPLGETILRRHGAPYLVLARADLHRVLCEATEASPLIAFDAPFTVARYTQTAEHIDAFDGAGEMRRGKVLIGADGVWSEIRKQIAPGIAPRLAGHAAWRATIPMSAVSAPFADNITGLWLGPRVHLVHYPVQHGAALNVVAVVPDMQTHVGWDSAARTDVLARRFTGWFEPVRALVALPSDWRIWSLYTLPKLRLWSDGRATLLGDAAHPVLPYLAQGGALAIEDAAAIAAAIAASPDEPCRALQVYENRRRTRVSRVQRHAARLGYLYHLRWPADLARNRLLSARRPEVLLASLDWLYGS